MPRARGLALTDACRLVADGTVALDPGSDRIEVEQRLLRREGHRPVDHRRTWPCGRSATPTCSLPTDLGVLRGLAHLGGPVDPKPRCPLAEGWRPWRSYALHHLWSVA